MFILCICDGAVSLDFRLILFQQHLVQYVISPKSCVVRLNLFRTIITYILLYLQLKIKFTN